MKILNLEGVEVETRVRVDLPHPASVHHVADDAGALHEQARQEGVRPGHVLHRGVHYPVNDHWHAANTVPWPWLAGAGRLELCVTKDDLLDKSDHVLLTPAELAYLRAACNHFNVRTCIDLLGGRDHADFGFGGVDQLHFGSQGHRCGCTLVGVFDHHKGRAGVIDETHKHPPLRACRHHEEHVQDLDRLHGYVAADHSDPEFLALLDQEREAEKEGLPLPPKWAPQGRA